MYLTGYRSILQHRWRPTADLQARSEEESVRSRRVRIEQQLARLQVGGQWQVLGLW
jgi:hypothetical protein